MKIIIRSFIFLFAISILLSQQSDGTRDFNVEKAKQSNIWYDSTTATFQTQYPIITNIPPLNSGMPVEIKNSYIFLDSLLKNTSQFQVKNLLNSWDSFNDTLGNAAKYYYKLKDYNPVIFTQYAYSVRDYKKFPKNLIQRRKIDLTTGEYIDSLSTPSTDSLEFSGVYTNDLFSLETKLTNKYNDFIPASDLRGTLSLLYSDYILKVRILNVDSMEAKNSTVSKLVYGVHAEVLDTIKGNYFKNECEAQHLEGFSQKDNNTLSDNPCIKFMYKKEIYDPNYKRKDWINDPLFEVGYNSFGMQDGQEAIVFLKFNMRKIDNEFDYLGLLVHKFSSNGTLPIINGQVRDLNHFWSSDDLLNYQEWKNILLQLKNNIINLNY